MNQTVKDNKQKRQIEFLQTHTLTREDFRKLIEAKFARAEAYSKALEKREISATSR